MIIIHAGFTINPAKKEAFLNEIKPLIQASREEGGNISYKLYQDTENENVFTMVELWKDGEAVAAHNQSEHFTAFTGRAKEFLAAPLDVKVFNGEQVER
ncbi:putative quinol monooxygenase [Falsibacillus pallidus]|uniref:putative quinol monooxygenase n=1 Tax=Falsibacillus pallidus TaxID=493781 RepID=UPI003D961B3A